jgi:hypothetical protein
MFTTIKVLSAVAILTLTGALTQPADADHFSFGFGVGAAGRPGGGFRGGIVVGPGPYVVGAPIYYAPPNYYSFGPAYYPSPGYPPAYCYPGAYYSQPYAYPYITPWAGYSWGSYGLPSFTGYGVYRTWNGR